MRQQMSVTISYSMCLNDSSVREDIVFSIFSKIPHYAHCRNSGNYLHTLARLNKAQLLSTNDVYNIHSHDDILCVVHLLAETTMIRLNTDVEHPVDSPNQLCLCAHCSIVK